MERKLTEQELVVIVRQFAHIHRDGYIEINDSMLENANKVRQLKALNLVNKRKYKLQYTII